MTILTNTVQDAYNQLLANSSNVQKGTWEITENSHLSITGPSNGSIAMFSALGALNDFTLEWTTKQLGGSYIHSNLCPVLRYTPEDLGIEGGGNNYAMILYLCNYHGDPTGTFQLRSENGKTSVEYPTTEASINVDSVHSFKLVRSGSTLTFYEDDALITTTTNLSSEPLYLGWYLWFGGSTANYQTNFVLQNYRLEGEIHNTNIKNYLNKDGLAKIWANTKSYITSQLLGKSNTGHTHSKSDVTDLFNSANTWTGDNTYTTPVNYKSTHTLGNLPVSAEAQQAFKILDSAGTDFLCDATSFQNTTASGLRFTIRDKFDSSGFSPSGTNRNSYLHFLQNANSQSYLQWDGYTKNSVVPLTSNTYDLGTSSYKWRKVYSDDVVHTSGDESVSGTKSFNSDLNLNYASTDVDDIVNSVAGSATLDNFVHMTGDETVNGIKSFPDGVIANVTGSATSATNDGSGNVISSTYGKLGAANTWTNAQIYPTYNYGQMIWLKNTGLDFSVNGNTGLTETYQHTINWADKNNTSYSMVQSWTNSSENVLVLRSYYRTDANTLRDSSIRNQCTATAKRWYPETDADTDLGAASNQWNNLYAKNYYYNGTQWGLDQNNTWMGRQTFGAYLKSFGEARTDEWSSNSRTNAYLLSRRDTDEVSGFLISTYRQNTEQGIAGHIYGWDILENSTRYSGLRFTIDWDSTLNSGNGAYRVTLGTNTQGTNPCNDLHITQLKTINGVNPGELSLPNMGTTVSQTIDITDWYIPDPDDPTYPYENAKKIDDSVEHTIEGSSHVGAGYIHISIPNVSGNYAYARQYAMGTNMNNVKIADGLAFDAFPNISFVFPIVNALKVRIKAKTAVVRFFPCLGNV